MRNFKFMNSLLVMLFCILTIGAMSCSGDSDPWREWDDFDKMEVSDADISVEWLNGLRSERTFFQKGSMAFFEAMPERGEYIACLTSNDEINRYNTFMDNYTVPNGSFPTSTRHLPYIDESKQSIIFVKAHSNSVDATSLHDLNSYKYIQKGKTVYIRQEGDVFHNVVLAFKREPGDYEYIYPLLVNRPNLRHQDILIDLKINSHVVDSDLSIDHNMISSARRKYELLKCKGCDSSAHR